VAVHDSIGWKVYEDGGVVVEKISSRGLPEKHGEYLAASGQSMIRFGKNLSIELMAEYDRLTGTGHDSSSLPKAGATLRLR
jgi:hypothetical protein